MKGSTTIELTNVKTQKREVYQDTNMFTNALEEIFSNNSFLSNVALQGSKNFNSFVPVVTRALGGLFLFPKRLEESKANIFPSTAPVGYAGSSTTSTNDPRQGIYNTIESGAIDHGYRHVWDFGTSKANGIIESLALTNANAGNGMYPYGLLYDSLSINFVGSAADARNMVCLDKENGVYGWYNKNSKIIRILRKNLFARRINCFPDEYSNSEIIKDIEIPAEYELSVNSSQYMKWDVRGNIVKGCVGIKPKVNSDREYLIVTLDSSNYNCDFKKIAISASNIYESSFVLRSGNIYVIRVKSDGRTILKIKEDNPYDVVELGLRSSSKAGDLFHDGLTDLICTNDKSYLFPDDSILDIDSDYNGSVHVVTNSVHCETIKQLVYYNTVGSSSSSSGVFIAYPTYYLATINNLEQPITKTAEQTLKITYTIKETEA